ncbi:MAG: sugar ABC transporter substrate-binding protein [Woeseiaceae bacterium]|nr:sugar ABC transporter substrate-binding protein [Woeseiaceae bacterium]
MPRIRYNRNLIFGLLLTAVLAACDLKTNSENETDAPEQQPVRVALIMKSLANEYFINMMEGAKAHQLENAEKYELIVNGTKNESDLAQQVSLVEQMMAAQVDILVLAPVNSKGMLPVVKRAIDQGIVVVNIDNRFDQDLLQQMGMSVPFVGPADREGAKLVGQEVAKYLKAGAEVAIIGGLPGAYNAQQRQAGFEDAMTESGLNIISIQSADWESAKSATVAAAILSENPNLKALLCSNDSMALGAVAAVRQAGRTGDVFVVGFDNLSAANDLVQSGELLATIDQHGDELAVYGIEYALQILHSGVIPENIITPVDLIVAK